MSDWKSKCDECHKRGGTMFARLYWRPVGGKWEWVCPRCWDILNQVLKN